MTRRKRSLLGVGNRRATIDMTASPPRVIDSPDADSDMIDPLTNAPLLPVSDVPGAMPTLQTREEPVDSSAPAPPRTAPPPLRTPRPSLGTPTPLAGLRTPPRASLPYVSLGEMGRGHVPVPMEPELLTPFETQVLAGLLALGLGFVFTGFLGIGLLWLVVGEELFAALRKVGWA